MNNNIIYFHHYNDYSGSTKVLADILSSTYCNMDDVIVITDNTKQGFLSEIGVKMINVPILRIGGRAIPVISQILWVLLGLFKTIKYGTKFKTFYINTIIPMYAALGGRLMNKNIIYHIHEKYVNKSIKSRMAEYVFNHVKAERRYVSNYVCSMYKPKEGCISKIQYNKLSRSFVNGIKIKPLEQRSLNKIIMIASLQRAKGVDNLVKIAYLMPDMHFDLILSASEEKIDNYFNTSLPSNLNLYPSQSDIHPFLYNSDLLLNLSIPNLWVETFGMTIIEGMAYGLPSIVPNVGGPKELVENGYNGYSIDVSDVNLVINKIREILQLENYNKMSNNALIKVRQFEW